MGSSSTATGRRRSGRGPRTGRASRCTTPRSTSRRSSRRHGLLTLSSYTELVELSHRRILTLVAVVAASVGCVGLVLVRVSVTGVPNFLYLVWNLFLAWIPFVLALALYDGRRRGWGGGRLLALGVAWLAFFPNAPYIVTDFVHLNRDPLSPLWYD